MPSIHLLFGLYLAAGAAAVPGPPLSSSQESPVYDRTAALMGSQTFRAYCASCHGSMAEGNGVLADQLRFAPSDLTRIARRNAGKFPFDKVAKIIDGRSALKSHGGTDMPVWGDAFRESRDSYSTDKVKERIEELVHYLASLQK
jgi:mono/diheme cytochrome c family protein